jgi:hypothetical protein
MQLTWTNIFFAFIPIVGGIAGAILKAYVDNQVQNLRIENLEGKVEHINNNWKQRDIALMKELKELKEEIHQLSIQVAEINAKK